MKHFNTTTVCIPEKHYMVDITDKLEKIRELVDAGKYFTVNCARQYGKTTVLTALDKYLSDEYDVISIDFQDVTDSEFKDEGSFTAALARLFLDEAGTADTGAKPYTELQEIANAPGTNRLSDIFRILEKWCRANEKQMVLIIDEVDGAAGSRAFIDMLSMLRAGYIKREKNDRTKTFRSVILAGIADIRYLKSRMEGEEGFENSPWNVAADFNVDMSLSEDGIRGMLDEYEKDHRTGMDTGIIAKEIRACTNGYPFLVSRICQLTDERLVPDIFGDLSAAWTVRGMDEAVKLILAENNTLFQSLTKNLNSYPVLKSSLRSILMEGVRIPYNGQQDDIVRMQMYGLIRNDSGTIRVANRIFETMLYNLFLSEEKLVNNVFYRTGDLEKNRFVENGRLNMRLVLEGFSRTFREIFGPLTDRFREKDGRELFLLYLKPIINGTGNYYIEAQTRDQTRTDVIVDYLGEQYIIELKIWRGERYNAKGEQQIYEYLDYFGVTVGYMLSFNFNKNKAPGLERVEIGDRILYECTV